MATVKSNTILTIIVTIVVLVALIGLAQLLSAVLGHFKTVDIFNGLAIIVIVSITASIVGSIAAYFTTLHKIELAESRVEDKLEKLYKAADKLEEASEGFLKLGDRCEGCANLLARTIESARDITRIALDKFEASIISYEDLIKIEAGVRDNSDIWVLTSALKFEEDELSTTIIENLKRGIKYTYLIPKQDGLLEKKMLDLGNFWRETCNLTAEQAKNQIRCLLVPEHYAYMTVVAYDPYGAEPEVLVKFPLSDVFKRANYPLIYRIEDNPPEARRTFIRSIQDIMDGKIYKCEHKGKFNFEFS